MGSPFSLEMAASHSISILWRTGKIHLSLFLGSTILLDQGHLNLSFIYCLLKTSFPNTVAVRIRHEVCRCGRHNSVHSMLLFWNESSCQMQDVNQHKEVTDITQEGKKRKKSTSSLFIRFRAFSPTLYYILFYFVL